MIKPYTKSRHTNLYIQAAYELNLKVGTPDPEKNICLISHNNKELLIKGASLSVNSVPASRIAKNKHTTITLLKKNNIPVPGFCEIYKTREKDKVLEFAENKYPVVAKPIDGLCGKGVTANIKNQKELLKAIEIIEKTGEKELILEKHVSGRDYRILIFNGQILDILERIPAFIQGNGQNTVSELIQNKNTERIEKGLPEINVDLHLIEFLKLQNLTLEAIPPADQKIDLRSSCNFSKGGEVQRIPVSDIPNENIKLFKKIPQILFLNFCGIDYISPDILKSYKETPSGINEVNHNPGISIHYFANMQKGLYVPKKLLNLYFK